MRSMLTISDDCHKEVAVFQQHCTVAECFHQPLAAKSWPPLARGFKAGPWLSTARPRAIRPDAPARLSAAPAHPVVAAGKTSYWDERYTKDPEPFDWYQRYSGIQARRGAGMERVAARRRVFGHRRGRLARRPAAAPARPRETPPAGARAKVHQEGRLDPHGRLRQLAPLRGHVRGRLREPEQHRHLSSRATPALEAGAPSRATPRAPRRSSTR